MAPDPSPDPDLTIVLLGNTGVGKSASGNTILGRGAFESKRSFAPVTKQICEKTGNVFGKQISVVDTQGIFGSEDVIQTDCQKLLQSSRPCLFLIVVKIDRFTIEQKNAVDAAIRVIGDKGLSKCYLLFTQGDHLDNTTLDEFINGDPDGPLKPLAGEFAGRLHVFNNKNGGQEQVRELLKKSGHLTDVDHPRTNRRIVLFGLPGKGKSATGNTILGSNQFESDSDFNSVTKETVSKSAAVEGRQVTVVDTPGFSVSVLKPAQLYREIVMSLVKVSPGPHAFIFVVSVDRILENDIQLFELLPQMFESDVCDAHRYSMVLFTHGDKLKGKSIDVLIKSNPYVSALVSLCGRRYCVFDNKDKNNREQVRKLLDQIDEMVENNGGQHFTNELFMFVEAIKEEIHSTGGVAGKGGPSGDTVRKRGASGDTVRKRGPVGDTVGKRGPVGDTVGKRGPVGDTVGKGGPSDVSSVSAQLSSFLNIDDMAVEKVMAFLDTHKYKILIGTLGVLLGGIGGLGGGLLAAKFVVAAKLATVTGVVVGGVVGGAAGGAIGFAMDRSVDSKKKEKKEKKI